MQYFSFDAPGIESALRGYRVMVLSTSIFENIVLLELLGQAKSFARRNYGTLFCIGKAMTLRNIKMLLWKEKCAALRSVKVRRTFNRRNDALSTTPPCAPGHGTFECTIAFRFSRKTKFCPTGFLIFAAKYMSRVGASQHAMEPFLPDDDSFLGFSGIIVLD